MRTLIVQKDILSRGACLGRAALAVFCVLISMPWEGFLRLVAAESVSAPPATASATNAPTSTASAPASPFTNAVPISVFHETAMYGVRDPFCPIGYIRTPPLPPGVQTNIVKAPEEVKEVVPRLVVKAIAFGIALLDGGKNLKVGAVSKYTGPDGTVDYKVLSISEDTVTIFCNKKQYQFKVGGTGDIKDLIEKPESDQKDPAEQLQQFNEKE
ncbi:MAG: hypothetical protein HY360_09205 [Verrucomicrobia bacterium]|nr:hypothetical protein [Verrucomicrobiota bacterium]